MRIGLKRTEGRSHNDGLQVNVDVSATGVRGAGLNGKDIRRWSKNISLSENLPRASDQVARRKKRRRPRQ